jgi:hypothetical protein
LEALLFFENPYFNHRCHQRTERHMGDDLGSHVVNDEETVRSAEAENLDIHLKEWQRISDRISAQLAPGLLTITEAAQQLIEPILEAQKTFRSAFDRIAEDQKRWAEAIKSIEGVKFELPKFDIPRFDLPDLSLFATQAEQLRNSFRGLVGPAFEEFQKSFRDLPPRTQEAVLLLGSHGWYFDLEMTLPQLWRLKEELSDGNVSEAEEAFVDYFEGRSEEIEKSIATIFPNRSHLIRAAFGAHRRQEYELSIPVFLAQADGMCKDAINQYLFLKTNRKPQTALYVERIVADGFRASLLSPLAQTLPISASESERPRGSNALNRHAVLHGESLDYGTKTNSLKAISLINYIALILADEIDGADRKGHATAG